MSTQHQSDLKHFTRGGQIFFHNFRMSLQVIKKVAGFGSMVLLLINVGLFFWINPPYARYVAGRYVFAKTIALLPNVGAFQASEKTIDFVEPTGVRNSIAIRRILASRRVNQVVDHVFYCTLTSLLVTFLLYLASVTAFVFYLKRTGKTETEHKALEGDRLAPQSEVKQLIESDNCASDLVMAGLPLVKGAECQHMLFDGTTGSGKSTAIKQLLDQIRARGDRAIIYDKSCNLFEAFFEKGDTLLNPLDGRGQAWNLWKECEDKADFDSLAAALIPQVEGETNPFWSNSARSFLSQVAYSYKGASHIRVKDLLAVIFDADSSELKACLAGTPPASTMAQGGETVASGIKSVIASHIGSLALVDDDGDKSFSIRDWVQSSEERSWLFLTSKADRHASLKPLITTWLDIAISALMSMDASSDRRVWFILDELPSLNRLPSLEAGLSESRKFGGCFVLGWQNIAQMRRTYGVHGAASISSLLNTRFMYRQVEAELAQWSSKNLGEKIIDEAREGVSYGANTIRDGVSIQRLETRKPIISFSEVILLPDLQCYVRLPNGYPVTRLTFEWEAREKRMKGFVRSSRKIEPFRKKAKSESVIKTKKVKKSELNALKKSKKKSDKTNDSRKSEAIRLESVGILTSSESIKIE